MPRALVAPPQFTACTTPACKVALWKAVPAVIAHGPFKTSMLLDLPQRLGCAAGRLIRVSTETFRYINPRLPTQSCNTRILDSYRLAEGERSRR